MAELPKPKFLRTIIISEEKIVRLFEEDTKYLVELIGDGYKVRFSACETLKEARKLYTALIKRIKAGGSAFEPI